MICLNFLAVHKNIKKFKEALKLSYKTVQELTELNRTDIN